MRASRHHSAARAILVVGILLLALVPGIIPIPRTNGTAEFTYWPWALIIALAALAPYTAIFLLSQRAQPEPRQRLSRGLAAGTALTAIGVLGFLLLVSAYVRLFGSERVLTLRAFSLIVLILMNAWMLWRVVGKDILGDATFIAGAIGAVAFASVAFRAVERIELSAVHRVQTDDRGLYTADYTAMRALQGLALCASAYRMAHAGHLPPEEAGLAGFVATAGCDASLASPSIAPHYTIVLSVSPADTLNAGATMGCTFTATFNGELPSTRTSRVDGRTLWSTCAGRVYTRERDQPAQSRMPVSEGFPLEVSVLFRALLIRARESSGRYPVTLSALLASPGLHERRNLSDLSVLGAQRRTDLDSNVFRSGRYLTRYVRGAGGFHLDVLCDPYGAECMRQYVVDTAGIVRATGEPRPARSTDPLAERCEFANMECNGQPGVVFKPRALTSDSL
ncbi:MAG TPA: hypothetical protein VN650_09055 [Gemmatimonadaceae bacterium]|nr:hypothetical protein [Gemmatimonadaceae bacterium]